MDKNHPYVQFLKQWNERCKGKIDIYIQTIRNNRMQKLKQIRGEKKENYYKC